MGTERDGRAGLDLRLPLIVVALMAIVGELAWLSSAWDLVSLGYLLLLCPLVMVVFLVGAVVSAVRKRRSVALGWFLSAAGVVVVGLCFFKWGYGIRTESRWLMHAKEYKAAVLALPDNPDGELKHVEWDVWGWAGMDSSATLAYDPEDWLAVAAKTSASGRMRGVSVGVARVYRLENHWYSVLTYTNEPW